MGLLGTIADSFLVVLQRFQENLVHEAEQSEEERDQYFGLSLRELVHTYKWQTLVLFKCLLLQPKVSVASFLGHKRSTTDHR